MMGNENERSGERWDVDVDVLNCGGGGADKISHDSHLKSDVVLDF